MKTLFNTSLSAVGQLQQAAFSNLPVDCKELLLEWLSSHDLLTSHRLMADRDFGRNLTRLRFYLSEQLTDEALTSLAVVNRQLEQITLIYCPLISDVGLMSITREQRRLVKLELRSLMLVTSLGLSMVDSPQLHTVDLSGCWRICSNGVVDLIITNRTIQSLYLNNCRQLDDRALEAIGLHLGPNLSILELDFLPNLANPSLAIYHLSRQCPNIRHLSLCRYFNFDQINQQEPSRIDGTGLLDLDLYGNYFLTLPRFPATLTTIHLSCCGDEDVQELIRRLRAQRSLTSLQLQITCDNGDIGEINEMALLRTMGPMITKLQLNIPRLSDGVVFLISDNCSQLQHLVLNVSFMNTQMLLRYFARPLVPLLTLKLCRLPTLSIRLMLAIARSTKSLQDLEMSHMHCVDDRFLRILAGNCHTLSTVNFNGCTRVTDRGLNALARRCPLKEVRIRATSVTDDCLYVLAQFCPDLEWIAHADFSGKPKFSDQALQCLRDSCIQRVIC